MNGTDMKTKTFGIIVVGLMALASFFQNADARAQGAMSIAALVNDEAISVYDLGNRIELAILSAGLPRNREVQRKLAPQVLRTLVNEKLQLQEAERLGLKISDSALKDTLDDISRKNPAANGDILAFVESKGIDKQSVIEQTKANIAWFRVLNRETRRKVKISKEEIDAELARIEANKKKPQRQVSEIFFAVTEPGDEKDTLALANRLREQLNAGANFGRLAAQFSQSPSAAAQGNLGWLYPGQLDPRLEQVLDGMKPGQVSQPIRTLLGYYILRLNGVRKAGSEAADKVKLQLQQVVLTVPEKADKATREGVMAQGRSIAQKATNCSDMDAIGKKVGSPLSGSLGTVEVGQLPSAIRNLVENLPVNRASTPAMSPNGVMVFMVCSREAGVEESEAAKRARIKQTLENERRELVARQLMRDLHRSAIIDIRL